MMPFSMGMLLALAPWSCLRGLTLINGLWAT
jgi:hypothetical protein